MGSPNLSPRKPSKKILSFPDSHIITTLWCCSHAFNFPTWFDSTIRSVLLLTILFKSNKSLFTLTDRNHLLPFPLWGAVSGISSIQNKSSFTLKPALRAIAELLQQVMTVYRTMMKRLQSFTSYNWKDENSIRACFYTNLLIIISSL